jgi:predicted Zn-ribbon and HTH transcriptional regulator
MKYPSLQLAQNLINNAKNKKQNSIDEAFDLISQCVDYFFEGENIFYVKEMDKKEVIDYLENIPKQSFDKIEKFFETAPKVISIIEHQCEKCGYEHKIPMEGLVSFFD